MNGIFSRWMFAHTSGEKMNSNNTTKLSPTRDWNCFRFGIISVGLPPLTLWNGDFSGMFAVHPIAHVQNDMQLQHSHRQCTCQLHFVSISKMGNFLRNKIERWKSFRGKIHQAEIRLAVYRLHESNNTTIVELLCVCARHAFVEYPWRALWRSNVSSWMRQNAKYTHIFTHRNRFAFCMLNRIIWYRASFASRFHSVNARHHHHRLRYFN